MNMLLKNDLPSSKLISQINAGIGLIDEGDHLTQVNPYMTRLLGYTLQDMIGQPISAFIKPEQKTFLDLKLDQIKLGHNFFIPVTLQCKDGQQIDCLLSFSGIHPDDGGYQGAAFFILDIKQDHFFQLLTDRQVLQKGRQLSELNRIMTEIARTWELDVLLKLVFSSIQATTGFDGGGFFAYRHEKPRVFAYPPGEFFNLPGEMVKDYRRILKEHPDLFKKRAWILSEDYPSQEELKVFDSFYAIIHPNHQARGKAVLLLSVADNKRTRGVFGFYHQSEQAFTSEMIEMADIVTSHAAIAIENIYLLRDLETFTRDKERLRLSRELHDSVAQGLYSLMLYGETTRRALAVNNTQVVASNLDEMTHISREAMNHLRLLIFELRPPIVEEIGLTQAIVARLESIEKRSGTHAECNILGNSNLTPDNENQVYWIVHEALNNVLKHAKAKNVWVDIHFTRKRTMVIIKDDGIGFDVNKSGKSFGVGLKSITERVDQLEAQLKIISEPDQGTTIEIMLANKTA
jgi:PAS domain S-box-containing protein